MIASNVLALANSSTVLPEKGIINESIVLVSTNKPQSTDWFKVFKENTENVKAELKDTDKDVVEKETAGYDYKAKNNNNISTAEMLKGYYVEMKDPKNVEKTEDEIKAIVVKNLEKDPLFYVKDGEFGLRGVGYSSEHPGLPKDIYGNYALGIEPKVKLTGKYKSSGTVTLTERVLTTEEFQVNLELCKLDLAQSWQSASMGYSAFKTLPKTFADFLL